MPLQLNLLVLTEYQKIMDTFSATEVRNKLLSLLKEVESGKEIGITFGRKKQIIAVIVPIDKYKKIKTRKLGTLEGEAKIYFRENWEITEEELLNS